MSGHTIQPREPLLGESDRASLGPGVHEVSYPKGSLLASSGDRTDFVLYLIEGHVKSVQHDPECILDIHRPGDFAGELAALTSQPRSCDLVALTDIRALFIPADIFLKLLDSNPRVALDLLRGLAERVQALGTRAESLPNAEQKLARAILDITRSGIGSERGLSVELTGFSQRDLASLAGISRESVSAILRPLKSSGTVSVGRQRITIHDLAHFEVIAQRVDHAL